MAPDHPQMCSGLSVSVLCLCCSSCLMGPSVHQSQISSSPPNTNVTVSRETLWPPNGKDRVLPSCCTSLTRCISSCLMAKLFMHSPSSLLHRCLYSIHLCISWKASQSLEPQWVSWTAVSAGGLKPWFPWKTQPPPVLSTVLLPLCPRDKSGQVDRISHFHLEKENTYNAPGYSSRDFSRVITIFTNEVFLLCWVLACPRLSSGLPCSGKVVGNPDFQKSFPVVFYRCVKLNNDLQRVKSLWLTTNKKTIITTNIYGDVLKAFSHVTSPRGAGPSVWVWTCLLVAIGASSHLLGRCQSLWGQERVYCITTTLRRVLSKP